MKHWKLVLSLVAALVVLPAMAAFGWSTQQSAFAACVDGQVTITVAFNNTDKKAMDVVATDEQTGLSVGLGTVPAGQSASAEIHTGLSSVGNGKVSFLLAWSDGKKGTDTVYAKYTGVECEEPPVDVCPNLEGDQETVPDGLIIDENGNCVEPPPPPTAPAVTVGLDCDAGVIFSWPEGPENEHRVLAVLGPDTFYAEQRMDQGTSLAVPFGGPYQVYILNRGGDEEVEFVLEDLWGDYPEPAECTPTTTTPEPPPTTTPEPPPTTTPEPPPSTPTTQPAPDGDWAEPVPVQSEEGGLSVALIIGGGAVAALALAGARRRLLASRS